MGEEEFQGGLIPNSIENGILSPSAALCEGGAGRGIRTLERCLRPELKSGAFDRSAIPASRHRAPGNEYCPERGFTCSRFTNGKTRLSSPTTVLSPQVGGGRASYGRHWAALFVLTMLLASWSGASGQMSPMEGHQGSLDADSTRLSTSSQSFHDYTLFLARSNGSAGGDGFITTKVPSSGGQEEEQAGDTDVIFRSPAMLEDLTIKGRAKHGSSSTYYLPSTLFIKATGPTNATADWKITLLNDGDIVAEDDWNTVVCTPTFLEPCGFDERSFKLEWNGPGANGDRFNVSKGNQLVLEVRADLDCSSNQPGGPSDASGTEGRQFGQPECAAWIAYNEIDGASDRYSFIDVESNALKESLILVQRSGAGPGEDVPITEWFPNDVLSARTMQFRFHVTSSFGRFDVDTVKLTVISPSGSKDVDQEIDGQLDGVEDNHWGIIGTHQWTYPGGVESGEYVVRLEVTDIQGNVIVIDHPNLQMRRFGVALRHGDDRSVEYVAPDQQTSIPLQLQHRGSVSESVEVELRLLTSLGSAWFNEFDRDDGYTLERGGAVMNPILTLRAPSDLTGSPNAIEIKATATAMIENIPTVVHEDVLYLSLEKIDVYAPPMVSIWNGNHSEQYANSSRPDAFDTSIPRYVEDGEFTTFLIEIFNTGFDSDTFRIDVLERSKAIVQLYDNDTNQRILEDEGDGTFHTAELSRHTTDVFRLQIKPSANREDGDTGVVRLQVMSSGNGSHASTTEFTVQRTFGVRAVVVHDCDGVPLGSVSEAACIVDADDSIGMRIKVTNSATAGTASTWWRLINPADLPENAATDPALVQWEYRITDADGDGIGRVSLAPQESTEVMLDISPKQEIEVGNHTILLRIEEDTTDEDKAYFDLPIIVQVSADDPSLRVVQVSRSESLRPGETREVQMKVHNDGNSPLLVLLTATVEQSNWDADVIGPSGSPLIEIGPFEEAAFTLRITAPADANSGTEVPVRIEAEPYGTNTSFEEDDTAILDVSVKIEITGISERLMNEVKHPRVTTVLFGIGALLLLVAAMQNRVNRRRWAEHTAAQEEWYEDEEIEEFKVRDDPLPDPIGEEDTDDDDIELIELVDEDTD